MIITSLQNPQVKRLVTLQRKRLKREAAGVVVVEGHDELAMAVVSGLSVRELYVCPELMAGPDAALQERIVKAGAEVTEVARPVFEKIAYREGPDGWLAVAAMVPTQLSQLVLSGRPVVLVAEGIEKPGNLGAMLRSAAAAGATAVVSVDGVTDFANPNVVRASKGTLFTVPVAIASRAEFVAWARRNNLRLVATTPQATKTLWQADLASGGVAILIGAEHAGLSDELLAAAAEQVVIPMVAPMDSLNAATSAALLLYEVLRQRQG